MKSSDFHVKVSDLLKEPGRQDSITFEKMFSLEVPYLTQEGINGTLHLQSLDKQTVFAELEDVHAKVDAECDSCGVQFVRPIHMASYEAKFILPDSHLDDEEPGDEIFSIDQKTETINTEDMIVQAVRLQEPLVIRCADCHAKFADVTPDDEEMDTFEAKSNITFG